MILILSKAKDLSTDWVIDWLNYYNYPFLRINASDIYDKNLQIDLNEKLITINNKEIKLNEICAIWYRKFGVNRIRYFQNKSNDIKIPFFLEKEYNILVDTFLYILKEKNWLTNPNLVNLNKCKVLLQAKDIGFNIPETKIVSTKKEAQVLFNSEKKYIMKSIYDSVQITEKGYLYTTYTKQLNKEINSEKFPPSFMPSLIQERIEKLFEIRIFYIKRKIYSMAIFSQSANQTMEDFRDYIENKPNRNTPYKLPEDIESKICNLMESLTLNCGSIDLIMGTDNKIYFLEINPVGEFGMVDLPCNYNLHQIVAKELIKMDTI